MTIYLKQSTASQEVPLGYFVDSTDGDTAETGLTIANTDIKIWKNGATTLANKNSGGATHISGGVYYAVLDATDTDTLGPLVIFVHVAGALSVRLECVVLAANIFDSLVGGGDLLQVDVQQFGNAAGTFSGGRPEVKTDSLGTTAKADVNAEVVDVLTVDTFAQPGQAAPAATTTLALMLRYLYKMMRNKKTQTATTFSLYADDETTVDQKSTVSSSSGTVTRGEIASGP